MKTNNNAINIFINVLHKKTICETENTTVGTPFQHYINT